MAIKRKVVAGIDIGTTKVCCCIGEVSSDEVKILGSSIIKLERGVSQGHINHLTETSKAVKKAVDEAVQKADVDYSSVWVSIGGYRSAGIKISSAKDITARNRWVTSDDIEQLCRDAKTKISIPADFEVLHEQLQYFLLDGENEVIDPNGMTADKLSASLYLILTPSAVISNVRNALANADIQSIEGMALQQFASGCGVLSPDEMELGVVHINMGGGTTSISVIYRNRMLHTTVLPVGACQVTKDLAITLRTPLHEAEKLKLRLGSVDLQSVSEEEVIEVSLIGTNQNHKVSRATVCNVISARCSEILDAISRELKRIELRKELFTGIVLTGGGALLHGMAELTEEKLHMPVRIGIPDMLTTAKGENPGALHSTAAGLLIHARERQKQKYFDINNQKSNEKKKSRFEKFRDWMLGDSGN
jgi:cell division protein FtsA